MKLLQLSAALLLLLLCGCAHPAARGGSDLAGGTLTGSGQSAPQAQPDYRQIMASPGPF